MVARSLSLREKRLIQVAILLVIVVLASLLLRGGGGAPPPPGPVAAPVTAPSGGPPPAALPVAAVTPALPVVPPADLSQLRLYGLLASGAVIGFANGGQRLVPVGREALPGLTLVRIEQNHAVFQSASGEVRLGFDGIAAPDPNLAAAPPPAAGPQHEETLRYRLGLAPRVEAGRLTGYTVRANVEMPALARAGIQPGDVIVTVNGRNLDAQMLPELARIVASPSGARFEVERFGRRLQLSLRPR